MNKNVTIVTFISHFDERRGPINRLDTLIDYYRKLGSEIELFLLEFCAQITKFIEIVRSPGSLLLL